MAAPPFDFSSTIPLENIAKRTKKEQDLIKQVKLAIELEETIGGFAKLRSDKERISYLKQLINEYGLIEIDTTGFPGKSAEMSQTKRNKGNECFKQGKLQEALQLYTESMVFAPESSVDDTGKNHLALSFSNRSAALFHLKKYKLCLKDIEEALQAGYPNDLRYKLYERKGKCLNALHSYDQAKVAFEKAIDALVKSHSVSEEKRTVILEGLQKCLKECIGSKLATKAFDNWDYEIPIPKLPAGCNTTHPSLTSACKVMYNEERGRHVVAERDIRPGEVILVEEPYSSTLRYQEFADHCHHCCRRYVVPMVCKQCTIVYYCSPECRNVAWEQYHKYECSVPAIQGFNSYRFVLKAILITGLDNLLTYKRKQGHTHLQQPKHLKGCGTDGRYMPHNFNAMYHLITHTDALGKRDIFCNSFMAVFIMQCLKAADFFAGLPSEEVDDAELIVAEIALHLMMVSVMNSVTIVESVPAGPRLGSPDSKDIGTAVYVTLGLFNHSCDALTTWTSYGNIVVLQANRTVKKGEEVTAAYTQFCFYVNKTERQERLRQYQFLCSCKACVGDWPLLTDMKQSAPTFKCANCSQALPLRNSKFQICTSCNKVQDMMSMACRFQEIQDTMRFVYNEMFRKDKFSEALPLMQNCIEACEGLFATPFKEVVYVSLLVLHSMCCNLMGNSGIKK